MGGEGRLVFPIHIQSVNCIACILLGKWAKSLTFKKILGIFWRMLRISHSSSNNSIVTTYCIFQLTLLFIGIVYNAYLYDASECTCSSIRVATLMMCSQCPRRTILSSSVGVILGRRWRPPAFDCVPKHTAKAFSACMREDIRILGGDNPTS